jgi:hypothetical protein
LFESAWPPAPTLTDVPEPTSESAPSASAERVVDFSRPPIEGTVVAGVIEPEVEPAVEPDVDRRDENGATGWRIRTEGPERPERSSEAPAAREVVVPEIVDEPADRWATPPVGEPVIDLTDDGPRTSDVEVVDAPRTPRQSSFDLPERTRAVRIKTVKTNGKRRWVVDVLVKQPDADDKRK